MLHILLEKVGICSLALQGMKLHRLVLCWCDQNLKINILEKMPGTVSPVYDFPSFLLCHFVKDAKTLAEREMREDAFSLDYGYHSLKGNYLSHSTKKAREAQIQLVWAALLSTPLPSNLPWSKWDVVFMSRLVGESGLQNHWMA